MEKTFRETEYFLQTKVCQVRDTVDLPTFCLVTIFSVESEELELELEQPKKKRHPIKSDQLERTWKIHTGKIRYICQNRKLIVVPGV